MPRDLKELFEFGPYRLDAEDGSLRRGDEVIRLPRKAGDVLILLVEEPGTVRSREELMSRVWDANVGAGSLDYQVFLIRQALGKGPNGKDYVETVPRRGFRFTGTVRRVQRTNGQVADAPPALPLTPAAEPTPAVVPTHPPLTSPAGRRPLRAILVAVSVVGAAWLATTAATGLMQPTALRVVESRPLQVDIRPGQGIPLLTDGTRLYFVPVPSGNRRAVAFSGGPSVDVLGASGFWLLDPGGIGLDRLAIRSTDGKEGDLWVLPTGSGVPRRVGQVTAEQAAWSPDGRRIAFVSGGTLKLIDGDGSDLIVVSRPPGTESIRFPRWSPDGSHVRFSASAAIDLLRPVIDIWDVRRDGTGLRRVLTDWDASMQACCGAWTPDGRHFVFQVTRPDRRRDIWVLPEPTPMQAWLGRTQAPAPLTVGPLSLEDVVPSPDGRTLFAVGSLDRGELVRWDRTSRAFVPYLGGLSGTWVTFSPDRQWVAYVGYPDRSLWRARADGTDRRELVNGEFELDGLAWSPDGRSIAFRSRRTGLRMKNYLIPSSGGTPVQVGEEDRVQGIATWSADGTQLVFGDVPSRFATPDGNEVLHLYDVRRQTFSVVPGSQGLWTSRWSPDGHYIAALTIDHPQRMKLFDTTTGRWRTLEADHVNNPTWSRDSQYIYYDPEGGQLDLRRVDVTDGRVERLATIDFVRAVHSWSGLALDDSPIVLKHLSEPTIYALTLERRR